MSIDVTSRRSGRTSNVAGSNTESIEAKIQEDSSVNSQPEAEPPKLQNQNGDVASRKAESGMMENQLQSRLLNQTNKTISTGTNRATNQLPPTNTAALQKAFKMYGITNDQLQRYVVTGEEPEALKKAMNDANTKGEWSAVNIVRESYKLRADHLRANSAPNDKQARSEADRLDATSEYLTKNRQEIQTKYAGDKLNASNGNQNKIVQAMKDLREVGLEIEGKIKPAPL
jgi:hypothetical protein